MRASCNLGLKILVVNWSALDKCCEVQGEDLTRRCNWALEGGLGRGRGYLWGVVFGLGWEKIGGIEGEDGALVVGPN